jgi:hypothetical protein
MQFAEFSWLKYGGEKVVVGSPDWYFFKPGLNYMLARPDLAHAADPANDPLPAIIDFRDQLAAHGIHLTLMPIPNKDSIYPDHLSAGAKNLHGVIAPRTRELLEKLRAANVDVVDVFKLFIEARQQMIGDNQTPLYLAQDTHWSPAGVALAAKTVARHLIESGWVHRGEIGYSQRDAPVSRSGDILRMLQTPSIERSIRPENVPSVQVVSAADGKLYKDDPNAEVLVLGDSFMRIYQEDQPTAAGFIAHLAKELNQPLLSLVNDGGGSTLVREELYGRAPFLRNKKVVLWEFVERDIGIGIKGWQRTRVPELPKGASPTGTNSRPNSTISTGNSR